MARLAVDLQKTAQFGAILLYLLTLGSFAGIIWLSPYFWIGAVPLTILSLLNLYYKHIQKKHTLLRNFGLLAQARYIMESIGPELRQYFYSNDTEEKPFNRTERAEIYRKAKDIDSSSAFGSLNNFDHHEIKIRHSMFPLNKKEIEKFSLTFGEERGCKNPYTITKPIMISAMSFGALGQRAVQSLSKGAKMAGIPMNTGEGGASPYHFWGGADLIFQMGTAKFGIRNNDSTLNDEKLKELSQKNR